MRKDRVLDWDYRFLELALHLAQWSKDPSSKVGAVIVDSKRRVLGIGYNGFPRNVDDDPALYENRVEKYARVVHAEANAILNSTGDLTDATIYCTHFPCSSCAGLIIQSGISNVISYVPDEGFAQRLAKSMQVSEDMFNDAEVDYWMYDKE